MAKPALKKDETSPDNNVKKKNDFGPILINIVITSLVCAIFIGANYFLQSKLLSSQLKAVTDGENAADTVDIPEKGIILDLGEFTMNLADVAPRRFLKISVAIEVSASEAEAATPKSGGHGGEVKNPVVAEMEQYRPAIRDAIITVMTSKTSEELAKTQGKELSKQQITESVNNIFDGEREVIRVSFGEFIMQ